VRQYLVKTEEGNYISLMADSYEDALQWASKSFKVVTYPFNASRLTDKDRGLIEKQTTREEHGT
jgi:hypothetical protein